jgi:hypothetical protein
VCVVCVCLVAAPCCRPWVPPLDFLEQYCDTCKQRGATIGCASETCERSFHAHCAAASACRFDPQRHMARTGGLLCYEHVDLPQGVNALPGRLEDWVSALRKAMPAVAPAADGHRSQRPQRQRAAVRYVGIDDDDSAPPSDRDGDGDGGRSGSGADSDSDSDGERVSDLRSRQLATAVKAARCTGRRCTVCAGVFTTVDVSEDPLPLDVSEGGHEVPVVLRRRDDEWLSVAPAACAGGCGVVAHAACVGMSVAGAQRIVRRGAVAPSAVEGWLCDVCTASAAAVAAPSATASSTVAPPPPPPPPAASTRPLCSACGVPDGTDRKAVGAAPAMVRVQDASGGDARWMHMCCALWLPGVQVVDFAQHSTWRHSGEKTRSTGDKCGGCGKAGGAQLKCPAPGCTESFHPPCVVRHELYMEHVKVKDRHVRPRASCVAVYCRWVTIVCRAARRRVLVCVPVRVAIVPLANATTLGAVVYQEARTLRRLLHVLLCLRRPRDGLLHDVPGLASRRVHRQDVGRNREVGRLHVSLVWYAVACGLSLAAWQLSHPRLRRVCALWCVLVRACVCACLRMYAVALRKQGLKPSEELLARNRSKEEGYVGAARPARVRLLVSSMRPGKDEDEKKRGGECVLWSRAHMHVLNVRAPVRLRRIRLLLLMRCVCSAVAWHAAAALVAALVGRLRVLAAAQPCQVFPAGSRRGAVRVGAPAAAIWPRRGYAAARVQRRAPARCCRLRQGERSRSRSHPRSRRTCFRSCARFGGTLPRSQSDVTWSRRSRRTFRAL